MSHCDIRLIGDVVFWLALTGYRLSLTPIKYCVLDLGSFASITAPNERDTLKLKENYANDIVEEKMCVVPKHCGLKLKMLSPAPRLKETAHRHCYCVAQAMTL
jgi:hypothetical protein